MCSNISLGLIPCLVLILYSGASSSSTQLHTVRLTQHRVVKYPSIDQRKISSRKVIKRRRRIPRIVTRSRVRNIKGLQNIRIPYHKYNKRIIGLTTTPPPAPAVPILAKQAPKTRTILSKKIIFRIPKKKNISKFRGTIASYKLQGESVLPSYKKLKKSTNVDIRKLLDTIKTKIEKSQKQRLFVTGIDYETKNQENQNDINSIKTLGIETKARLNNFAKEMNEETESKGPIKTTISQENNTSTSTSSSLDSAACDNKIKIHLAKKIKNSKYRDAHETTRKILPIRRPRKRLLLFNPRKYHVRAIKNKK